MTAVFDASLPASGTEPIVECRWDFGAAGSSREQNPSFVFMDDGVYPVILTVTDNDGSTDD